MTIESPETCGSAVVCSDLLDGNFKTCPRCGAKFKRPPSAKTVYCSQSCHSLTNWETNREKMVAVNQATIKKAHEATVKMHRGSHGFGLTKRGRIDHCRAKAFRIRSPLGEVYEVKNLAEWCRANEDKFRPDDFPQSKTPLSKRAQVGFSLLVCGKGKACSWRGWTAVCVFDIETDPLARRVVLPSNDEFRRTDPPLKP